MTSRTRSPSYPSTPIDQAIVFARKIHQVERTNPIDRNVAAKAMGYTGISGRSSTVLSDLNQYGLTERAGKSEIRLTQLAVELLYPDTDQSWREALNQAAQNPELFQKVIERFTDGLPSANALQSFLVKQNFTHAAIPAAVRAFQETYSYLQNAIGSESNSNRSPAVPESQINQKVEEDAKMQYPRAAEPARGTEKANPGNSRDLPPVTGADVNFSQKKIWLGGVITNQAEAEELIATINALKPMLQKEAVTESSSDSPASDIFN